MKKDLKFGFMCCLNPVEKSFDYALSNEMQHIEMDLIKDFHAIETFDAKRVNKIKKLADENKISLSLHTPYTINPGEEVEFFRKANENYLKKLILLAKKLNCTHITAHMGFWVGLPHWEWKRKKGLDSLVKTIKHIIPLLRKNKIYLALENVNPMPKNSEFQLLGDSIKDLRYIYSELKSPYVKMCLDTGHANVSDGPAKYIQEFGKKIVCCHFHDNKGRNDEHLPVGRGTINWERVCEEFNKINFKGPFISEVFNKNPKESRKDFIKFF